jgi:hypothetical protein
VGVAKESQAGDGHGQGGDPAAAPAEEAQTPDVFILPQVLAALPSLLLVLLTM